MGFGMNGEGEGSAVDSRSTVPLMTTLPRTPRPTGGPPLERIGTVEMQKLPQEQARTYVYADGSRYRVENVTHLAVSRRTDGSDSHRLRREGGQLIYVAPGWIAIEFDGLDGWSF